MCQNRSPSTETTRTEHDISNTMNGIGMTGAAKVLHFVAILDSRVWFYR